MSKLYRVSRSISNSFRRRRDSEITQATHQQIHKPTQHVIARRQDEAIQQSTDCHFEWFTKHE